MLRRTLNLGIVAHVDAGKTTLTERLLFAVGVIDEVGSVDKGTTQTDSLPLEQQRGITIKAAVVSLAIDNVTVNLIDTPGHPDFIAEVERVLAVLDGAVLVISAVEGVQPQTRILMRALERLRIPTLIFVNKIDRAGADYRRVLDDISGRLTPATIAMVSVKGEGTRGAVVAARTDSDRLVDTLAEHDDALLAAYVNGESGVSPPRLHDALAAQTRQCLVHPLFRRLLARRIQEFLGERELALTPDDARHPLRSPAFLRRRKGRAALRRLSAGRLVGLGGDGRREATAGVMRARELREQFVKRRTIFWRERREELVLDLFRDRPQLVQLPLARGCDLDDVAAAVFRSDCCFCHNLSTHRFHLPIVDFCNDNTTERLRATLIA